MAVGEEDAPSCADRDGWDGPSERLVADFLAALRYRMENLETSPSSGERVCDGVVAARTREIARRIDAYGLPMAGMTRAATTKAMNIPLAFGGAGEVATAVDDGGGGGGGGENSVSVAQAGDDGEEEAWDFVSFCLGWNFSGPPRSFSFRPPPPPLLLPSLFRSLASIVATLHSSNTSHLRRR